MQELTNGTKHFNRKVFLKTGAVEAVYSDAFEPGAFQKKDVLVLEVKTKYGTTWSEIEGVIEDHILFWRKFIQDHGPYKSLPLPPSRVAEFES